MGTEGIGGTWEQEDQEEQKEQEEQEEQEEHGNRRKTWKTCNDVSEQERKFDYKGKEELYS